MDKNRQDKPRTEAELKSNKGKKKRKKRSKKRVLLTILLVIVMIGLIACLAVGGYVLALSYELPEITAADVTPDQSSFVYDQNGKEVAILHAGENRVYVKLNDIPDYLIDMVLASEDERFYQHKGVDVRSVFRALWVNVRDSISSGGVTISEGASTITMQLVRNVINETDRVMERKIKEALLALEFEKDYDKDEILEYYLNEIYMGYNIYGVEAAAQKYFNKSVGDITLAEGALLVGMIRNASLYNPFNNPEGATNIRNTVLGLVAEYKPELYGQSAIAAKAEPLTLYEGEEAQTAEYDFPWYVDAVIDEAAQIFNEQGISESYIYTGGLHIYTVLDPNVQRAMEEEYANDDNFIASSTGDIVESAMTIIDPNTGQIKGLMGGREYTARRGFNRATQLVRSPGSTIKPIVSYGPAVDLGYGAGTVIDDSPMGSWPRNDDGAFRGRITMRQAIAASRNVCAVKVLNAIGPEVGLEYGMKMGLPLVPEDANPALALGGLTYGVSPLEMAGAFSTFANDGIYIEPYTIARITDSQGNVLYEADPDFEAVMSEDAAYILTDMLTTAVNGGTGGNARISGWTVAGKTGTNGLPSSTENPKWAGRSGTKDVWFVGYTNALAGAVWMGYDHDEDDDGNLQYMSHSHYGGGKPAQLFSKIMKKALEGYPNEGFDRPEDVVGMSVDTKVGGSPTTLTPGEYSSSDLFIREFSPTAIAAEAEWVSVEICADTNMIASAYCPNKTSGVKLQLADGSKPSERVADYSIYISSTVCTTHTTPTSGTRSYYICTDPRHNGEIVLANVPSLFTSGGCPEEYREIRYYTTTSAPTKNCDLPDHQLSGGSSTNGDDEGSYEGTSNTGAQETLTPPYNVKATAGNGITITWEDANKGGSIAFVVERTNDGDRKYVAGKSYTDTNVTSGNSYTYRVYAYDENTDAYSSWSKTVTVSY